MAVDVVIKDRNGAVDKKIYGQFIEHALNCINGGVYDPGNGLSDECGFRLDVVEKAKELAPPILRFPGGTIMCQYHWEDAVGPMEQRIRRKNLIWGGELDPSFGTAEFAQFCRQIGAEPMICVNMASGTPEEAGNWVEYCNGTGNTYYANLRRSHGYAEPFAVKYWCIGNESNAEPDIGVHHDVNLYIRDAWEFIKFMKLTDDSIKTVIVGCEKEEWNRKVLDSLHSVTDYFSLHHYSGEGGKGLYGPFEGEKHLRGMVKSVKELLSIYPEKVTDFNPWYRFSPRQEKIKIVLDEWNIWDFAENEHYGLLQRYCWRDALWVASVLNFLIEEPSIELANMAQMVNVLAPIVTEKESSWYQTIAYPLILYRHYMLGERLVTEYTSPKIDGGGAGVIDALSICSVCDGNGKYCVALVNRDFEKDYEICLCGERIAGISEFKMISLTGDAPRAQCSVMDNCVHTTTATVVGEKVILKAGSINILFEN